MKSPADLLVLDVAEPLTISAMPDGPLRAAARCTPGVVAVGAVAIASDPIVGVGTSLEIVGRFTAPRRIDATGRVVMPGFVDPHTHLAEHLRELDTALAEFHRVLVPGGRLVFSVYHPRLAEAGKQANFEQDGVEFRLGALRHTLDDYRAAFERTGWHECVLKEHLGDEELLLELLIARR